jgi:hypothetical protein
MLGEQFHLPDQDILLALDGELPRKRAKQVRAHFAACWLCRSRSRELEGTIADFVSLHRRTLDPDLLDQELPGAKGSRALLKARLAEAAASAGIGSRFLQLFLPYRAAACICAAVLIALLGGKLLVRHTQPQGSAPADLPFASATIPDPSLTPGATRPVSISDVCAMAHEEVVHAVPSSLRQEVFKEYGIVNPRPEDYEIDYLIAPGLGGAEDIHNLWPEPSTPSAWNARVKDALEERLHQLVCAGKLDLPTAQHDIATDWITAYKKYLSPHSDPIRFKDAQPARRPRPDEQASARTGPASTPA